MQKELDEITAKRQKKGRNEEEAPAEEKTVLHGNFTPPKHYSASFRKWPYGRTALDPSTVPDIIDLRSKILWF